MLSFDCQVIINMAADRGAFIDQSQSLNIHMAEPNYGKLTSMHFHGWKSVNFCWYCVDVLLYAVLLLGSQNWHVLPSNQTGC